MKKAIFIFERVMFLFFVVSGCEPIEYLPIEKISTVTFDAPSGILEENNDEGISIGLHLMDYSPYTPRTKGMLDELAALQPKTLATIHGFSFSGDCAKALTDLDQVVKEVWGA